MAAVIRTVEPGSIAHEAGMEPGDILLSINGQRLQDLIDVRYLSSDEELVLEFSKGENGEIWEVEVEKDWSEPLGVEFVSPIFDRIRHCANRCAFCFVDQMPQGLRDTLYMKDDDYRLSFLTGNFITLTNLTEADWQRIETYRLSPMYVSVHTTDPELRQQILQNPRASQIREQLERLQRAGIEIHCQIVCMPGVNSGSVLEQTLTDLANMWPTVQSVAIVPVGLSQFRSGLTQIQPWTPSEAQGLVKQVTRRQKEFLQRFGTRLVWAADEFYLLAEEPIPAAETYEGYRQLENGIGLTAKFREEFFASMANFTGRCPLERIMVITSPLGAKALEPILTYLREELDIVVDLEVVINRFFGSTITVAGLLTGQDILAKLQGRSCAGLDAVLIPGAALNAQDRFLDDLSLSDLEPQVECVIRPIGSGQELARMCQNG